MSFLPENYEAPTIAGNYMKFEDGANKFLILGSAILGFEYWNHENKPVRSQERPISPIDIRVEDDGRVSPIKHFWAFPVWNYKTKTVSVLEITQKSIMGALQNLARSEDWGDPVLAYSITITRSGKGFDTEYNVVPNPKRDVDQEIATAWEETQANGFDITRLYTGGDPFTA